ncbi:MAG TPA: DUF3987 domain-containing protein [Bryobacteraceae bacterium]|nr:DUF3987 domain-containing protein [Bryobacteraceae bacterium]
MRGLGSGEALLETVSETDKRCLVLEPEFSRALSVVSREGSTLSATLQLFWDAGQAERRVSGKKLLVKGAHVSLIGHVTRDELLRRLSETEIGNGFGNRILWTCARRARILPHGGGSIDLGDVVQELKTATDFARKRGNSRLLFDAEARLLWEDKYPELSEGQSGLLGALTSRAEAHVVRLALIYCLLDQSPKIRKVHLQAALAVWRYCFASAQFVWGDALGDPTGDSILSVLRAAPGGLSRWDLTNAFSRNKSAAELDRGLGVLLEQGRIRIEKKETGGRPETLYVVL